MAESFLMQCRQNYFEGITPSNKVNYEKEGYKKVIYYAQEYFISFKYEDFAGFLMEGQYLIPLWAAHMLVEYGKPNKELMIISLNTIKEYSNNILAPVVAEEEKEWLKENIEKYNQYI
jgi:hypothetical protein